jgi:hypothetical protein
MLEIFNGVTLAVLAIMVQSLEGREQYVTERVCCKKQLMYCSFETSIK